MKHPATLSEVRVNMTIPSNNSQVFVMNNYQIRVHLFTSHKTKYSGLFCDKQRIHEISEKNQGCGRYSMLTRRSNIILDHSIKATSSDLSWSFFIDRFSSTTLSRLYQSMSFPVAI